MRGCNSSNDVLPADQGKYCDAKCKDPCHNARDCQAQQRQPKKKEEQYGTPTSEGTRHRHFTLSFGKNTWRLREPLT